MRGEQAITKQVTIGLSVELWLICLQVVQKFVAPRVNTWVERTTFMGAATSTLRVTA